MLTAGDFDSMLVMMKYYTNLAEYLAQRSVLYWNHTGVVSGSAGPWLRWCGAWKAGGGCQR